MSVKEWPPERRASAEKACALLRKDGYSYEAIAAFPLEPLEPWEAYELANPGKTPAQVEAWKARHHPNGVKSSSG